MSGGAMRKGLRGGLILSVVVAVGCQGLFEDLDELRFEPDADEIEIEPELVVATQPPEVVVAGEPFTVEIAVLDEGERLPGIAGHEVSITSSDVELGEGSDLVVLTGPDGVASFTVVIEEAGTGLVLEAALSRDEVLLASETDSFDVVAAAASEEHSWISTTDTPVADGVDEAVLVVLLADEFGNPRIGDIPVVDASGEGNQIGSCSATDVHGESTCAMTSEVFGEKTLEILEPLAMTGGTVIFERSCDHEATDAFGGGEGIPEDPYRICNPFQLGLIGTSAVTVQRAYILLRDLDMDEVTEFSAIGDQDAPFTGSFRGNGFEIRDLTVESAGDYVGLFGYIGAGGEIFGVSLTNVAITGSDYVGGLVGYNDGSIEGSVVTGQVEGVLVVGGMAGFNSGLIRDSGASVEVIGTGGDLNTPGGIGGLVGENRGGISRTSAAGDVSGPWRVGGLVGRTMLGNEITDSWARGAVSGAQNIGGFVGFHTRGSIQNSFATGPVTGEEAYGGFAGLSDGGIENAYSSGALMNLEEGSRVGGFIGRVLSHNISSSYWDLGTSGHDVAAGEISGGSSEMTGLETVDFADDEKFLGWDFEDIWTIGNAPDGTPRPILRWSEGGGQL